MTGRIRTMVLAATIVAAAALPATSFAGRGQMRGNNSQNESRTGTPQRAQLRDGSCLRGSQDAPLGTSAGASQDETVTRQGKAYGPGDGTGNAGTGPKDGTGYGAPSNR